MARMVPFPVGDEEVDNFGDNWVAQGSNCGKNLLSFGYSSHGYRCVSAQILLVQSKDPTQRPVLEGGVARSHLVGPTYGHHPVVHDFDFDDFADLVGCMKPATILPSSRLAPLYMRQVIHSREALHKTADWG